jgi:transposase
MTDAATQIAALRAALAAAEARAGTAEGRLGVVQAEAARAKAVLSGSEALIAHLRLEIEKLRREFYGQRSERKQRLLEQMELQLEEMEATAIGGWSCRRGRCGEGENPSRLLRAPQAGAQALPRTSAARARRPACALRLRSLRLGSAGEVGEDGEPLSAIGPRTMASETLEVAPRSWKVIQTVREKFTCRDCERISQPPAPFHPTPRGWAGPSLLAMIVFEKYGQHQLLNR